MAFSLVVSPSYFHMFLEGPKLNLSILKKLYRKMGWKIIFLIFTYSFIFCCGIFYRTVIVCINFCFLAPLVVYWIIASSFFLPFCPRSVFAFYEVLFFGSMRSLLGDIIIVVHDWLRWQPNFEQVQYFVQENCKSQRRVQCFPSSWHFLSDLILDSKVTKWMMKYWGN